MSIEVRLRRLRVQLLMALVSLGIGAGTLWLRDDLTRALFPSSDNSVPAIVLGFFFIMQGGAVVLMQYLRGAISLRFLDSFVVIESNSEPSQGISGSELAGVRLELASLRDTLEAQRHTQITALGGGDTTALAEALRPTIASDLADQLKQELADAARDAIHIREGRSALEAAQGRLRAELASLARRSNLNLVIGVLTTTIAVTLLAYMVLGLTTPLTSTSDVLSHYIPRVTVVLFIEVFSFFFLRLYRSTLAEIKHYQGELTSLTLRQVALETAWVAEPGSSKASLASEFVRVAAAPDARVDSAALQPKELAGLLEQFGKVILEARKG